MQEASAAARGMQIHGSMADRRAFLPFGSAFSLRLLGLAVSRNQGKGRMLVFVTELLLALPLLLTLHAFVVFEPLGVRSHQFDR